MKNFNNTIRLARSLRKGQHEKIAIQKAMDRFRGDEKRIQGQLPFENDPSGGEESHGEIDTSQTYIPDLGV